MIHTPAQDMVLAREMQRQQNARIHAQRELFKELDPNFINAGFRGGLRCRAMRDGHYCPSEDLEFIMMWSGT